MIGFWNTWNRLLQTLLLWSCLSSLICRAFHFSSNPIAKKSGNHLQYWRTPSVPSCSTNRHQAQLSMAINPDNDDIDYADNKEGDDDDETGYNENAKWEALHIRVARMRLEEENKIRFLKSRPAKLSYKDCKEWAQRQNMWESRDDWHAWIDCGEGLSTYIPSDPEGHYTRLGTWVSWDDFLGY